MKTKGTSVWEQYIEYAVLLVAIAVMGWFAWGAFGSKIEVREGKHVVSTETVDDELLSAAKSLEAKLRDGSPSPIEITQPAPLGSAFENNLAGAVSPNSRVVFPTLDMMGDVDSGQGVQSELRMYAVPAIDAPSEIRTRQWYGTIAEAEMNDVESLSDNISGPPHDMTWVQVAAKFNIDSVVESFASSSDDLDPIPSQWYENGADVFDIQIERQELQGKAWSDAEIVSVLPGKLSFREQLAEGEVDALERDAIVSKLRSGDQEQITKPDFYRLKGAKPKGLDTPQVWEGEEAVEDDSPEGKLKKELDKIEKKISRQAKKITKTEERIEEEKKGGGGAPLGGGGGGRGGGSSKLASLQKRLARENDQLAALFEEKEAIEAEIETLRAERNETAEVIMTGDVWVWAHDVTVDPGKTYRYRMTLQLANPFFGHKPSLYQEQKTLAQSVTIPSAVSAWTAGVKVEESKQWFVVDSKMSDEGLSPSPSDRGHVTVESFSFSDGEWVSKERFVYVGQPLEEGESDSGASWFVLDVLEDSMGDLVLLQSLETGEVREKRPGFEAKKNELRQLQQQVRNQGDGSEDGEDPEEPVMPPTGPRGGGGGGNPGAV